MIALFVGVAFLLAIVLMSLAIARRRAARLTVNGHRFRDPQLAALARLARGTVMQMATNTQSGASAQSAGRPQPQTTIEAPGGPFIRHSEAGRGPQYSVAATAFAGLVTQPLVARPGYFRGFRVLFQATGGVNGTNTVALVTNGDGVFGSLALVQMKDAFGTPLVVAPGYEALYLVNLFGGGFGLDISSDVTLLPSYTAPSVGASGTGNFQFASYLPLEFAKAYGVLSAANAALLPQLQWNFAAASSVFSTAPGTLPTFTTTVDSEFYWLPEGVAVEPPGLGSTRQWQLQQCNPSVASATSARVQLPRMGGYLDTIILEARIAGIRTDIWPGFSGGSLITPTARLQVYVDGIPYIDSTISEILDDMQMVFGWTPVSVIGGTADISGGNSRPTGVIAFSRKTALNQRSNGLEETGEVFLSTNPGTLIEINGSPWGIFSSGPALLNVLVGQVVPTGALIQGLPEL